VGFEPTEARHLTAFREQHLQPLGHLSTRDYSRPTSRNSCLRTLQTRKAAPAGAALVCLEGLEPPTYSSASCRSIQLSYRHSVPTSIAVKKSLGQLPDHFDWRRGRDLNPRKEHYSLTRLAGERLQPLGHLPIDIVSLADRATSVETIDGAQHDSPISYNSLWRGARADEWSGLENRRGASLRGFESHPLRQKNPMI
jgi:hypothetical protein